MEKDLKIQSDEIIRLNTELKRVTKFKDGLKSGNFELIGELESAKEDARLIMEEVERLKTHCIVLSKGYDNEIDTIKEEAKEKDERIKAVLKMCDKNESNHDYSCATDSVRALLTDAPINQ